MSIVINTNSAAISASNNLAASNSMLQKSLNRLSSGSKIVNPADDAGGLAVSMKLSAAAKRSAAANSNIGNSMSFLQTQDGALKVAGKVLDRMSELKTLSLDPTKNASDRANYNAEFTSLQTQLSDLAGETFNGVDLFGGSNLSVGVTESGGTNVTLNARDLSGADGVEAVVKDAIEAAVDALKAFANGHSVGTDIFGDQEAFDAKLDEFFGTPESGSAAEAAKNALSTAFGTLATAIEDAEDAAEVTDAVNTFNTAVDNNATETHMTEVTALGSVSLDDITNAIQNVATMRAENGAEQSRLNFASELLTVNKANLEAANSRIVDVDVAEESTQLARWSTLVQAGTAMLAQANQSSQSALRLLN